MVLKFGKFIIEDGKPELGKPSTPELNLNVREDRKEGWWREVQRTNLLKSRFQLNAKTWTGIFYSGAWEMRKGQRKQEWNSASVLLKFMGRTFQWVPNWNWVWEQEEDETFNRTRNKNHQNKMLYQFSRKLIRKAIHAPGARGQESVVRRK